MKRLLAICAVGILALSTGAYGAVINVNPGDSIQTAVTGATTGDTINIAAGTYVENNIVVDKQLIIQGAGSGSTTIDVTGGNDGILLEAGGSSAAPADRQTIRDLSIINATRDGIRAYKAGGFNLDHVTLENLLITSNGARGVELHNGTIVSDMEITNCELINNAGQGLRTSTGTPVDGLVIADSSLNGNSYGIYLNTTTSNLTISRSQLNNNTNFGLYMSEYGLMENIAIEDSSLNGNGTWGLVLWSGHAAGINGFSISGTSIDDNGLGAWIGADVISNVTIECSSVVNNTYGSENYYEGIEFNYVTLTNVVVKNTNIYGNLGEGIANYGTGIVDARDNWWGSADGPSGAGTGSGDAVTTNVDFDPWLTSLIGETCPPPPAYSCSGFEAPMDKGAVKVKKNRVLPLKAELVDGCGGNPVTDADIIALPVLQVMYQPVVGDAEDVTGDALSAGQGDDGNEFVYTGSNWQFNLKTKNYSALGTYTITMVSGDDTEYVIDPTCEAQFVIK